MLKFSFLAILFACTVVRASDLQIYGLVPSFIGAHPLQAATAKLDSLQKLGVNAVWLSPINMTDDPSPISYSITDYFHIRPDLGTEDDFRALVAAAHARGIKVLMDFVPNHTSNRHPFFLDAAARGSASQNYEFYDRDENGDPTHYFDWSNLMNLNYGSSTVREHITSAFLYWMDSFDVDGFRVDAAWGVQDRAPDFWKTLTATIRRRHPSAILLAEASARDPAYTAAGFDLAYDWTDELGKWAWEPSFNDMDHAGKTLKAALQADPSPEKTIHFLNNNDTGERFITRYGLNATRVASVMLQTLPGVPVLFTGDEVGAEYKPYDDGGLVDFSDRHQLLAFQTSLIALRKHYDCLRGPSIDFLASPASVLAYKRGELTIVLNFGSQKQKLTLALKNPRDLLTGRKLTKTFDVPAQSAFLIENQNP